jgi:DNA replication protein DnaC
VRTEQEAADYRLEAQAEMEQCPKCRGLDQECECVALRELNVRAFEAGVPRDFWGYTADDVRFNREAFDAVVRPYVRKLGLALKRGYGLLFLGDNGTGKTMFMSYVLMAVCRRNFSAFYTTMTQLAHDVKRGFNDREAQQRLDWYLTSDFVAVDEMGKERFKTGDTFMRTEFERILKARYDDARPTLIATNMDLEELEKMYGATFTSMLVGKYEQVIMEPGDFREHMRKRMKSEMRGE